MSSVPRFVALAAVLSAGGQGGCGGDDTPAIDGPAASADARVDAARPDARTDGLGTIGTVPGSCANGTLPGTDCQLLEVTCPGLDSIQVELRITEPPSGTALRGTVLVGTAGAGTSYVEAVARDLLIELLDAGFRVVQRQWIGAGGWLAGPGGVEALACRYATLLEYVHDSIHASATTIPMCAAASGEGASELAYALARYDRAADLDFALAIDGPTATRLDHGCLDAADPTWLAECGELAGDSACEVQACSYDGGTAALVDDAYGDDRCTTADATTRAALLDDSAGADGNVFAYPATPVQLIVGGDDCTDAPVQGALFADRITSTVAVTVVPGVGHGVVATETGAVAVRDALLAGCVLPD